MSSLLTRRAFVKTMGGAALLGAAPSVLSSFARASFPPEKRPRVALLYEEGFPAIDSDPIGKDELTRGSEGCDPVFLTVDDLRSRLPSERFDLLVTPYGSGFPVEAASALHSYLASGGAWVNLGGKPLGVPVARDGDRWRREVPQVAYHRRLGITQTFDVPLTDVTGFRANDEVDGSSGLLHQFNARECYALYVRFTDAKEFPDEDGSSGQRDAALVPLVRGVASDGTRLAAPFVMIDRYLGTYAGGRWIFATFNGTITPAAIRTLVTVATRRPLQLVVQPTMACYHEPEVPRFAVRLASPSGDLPAAGIEECELSILDRDGDEVASLTVPLAGGGGFLRADRGLKRSLRKGIYTARGSVRAVSPVTGSPYAIRHTNGFWVYDQDLLSSSKPLSLNGDYFTRGGRPYPVTGTTYMTSDVHRKFLLEPNPALWSRDFREMKDAGVNMVRTGIWTGWKNYMLDVGAFNETALRSLDAFFLTARQFDIPVIFTFFAFFPEAWGGKNPYLDPRAVAAQKVFLAAVAQRYAGLNDVVWDLINEPSFSSPSSPWSTRPNYDPYETERWQRWIRERATTAHETPDAIRERWRTTPDDQLGLPDLRDFDDGDILGERRPLKALDYRLFAQEMFEGWVKEMSSALRSNGNSRQLITVGQDEGGTRDRPSPQFFYRSMDFTCNHTWWLNDDLVWDSVMTKAPGKPNLIEETGVMFSEMLDGRSARTEEEMRDLLDRKLAIAIGTGNAGFIQWIWNTNCYMPSDNEASIGFLRADGTAKPELQAFRRYARFLREYSALLQDRDRAQVLMLVPHSQMFSVRDFATAATKRCVRVLQYDFGLNVESCSEYVLPELEPPPRLLVVPSACVLRTEAWDWLMKQVERGSILVISGPLDFDEYLRPAGRSGRWGLKPAHRMVAEEEEIVIGEKSMRASYRGDKMHRVPRAVMADRAAVLTMKSGKGTILWSPLPLELSDSIEPTSALYALGVRASALEPAVVRKPNDPSLVALTQTFRQSILCTLVSEAAEEKAVRLIHRQSGNSVDLAVPAQRAVMLLLDRKSGAVLGRSK